MMRAQHILTSQTFTEYFIIAEQSLMCCAVVSLFFVDTSVELAGFFFFKSDIVSAPRHTCCLNVHSCWCGLHTSCSWDTFFVGAGFLTRTGQGL